MVTHHFTFMLGGFRGLSCSGLGHEARACDESYKKELHALGKVQWRSQGAV